VCSGESKFSNKSIDVSALVNCDQVLIPIPDDIDTQEAFDGSFILDFDQFFKLEVYCLTVFFGLPDHFDVVDID